MEKLSLGTVKLENPSPNPSKLTHMQPTRSIFLRIGAVLATGSSDGTTKFWCTKTWQMQGEPIECGSVLCVRYSPSGELLAIGQIRALGIYDPGTRERVGSFKGHTKCNHSLTWTPDGTRLLSGGNDRVIREWDPLTWEQVGHPWEGHTSYIYAVAIHPSGTLVASASADCDVRIWRLSDRQTIAIFKHSSWLQAVTFSADGKHILSGGNDKKISEWAAKNLNSKILDITTARDACIAGDLDIATKLLTQGIDTDANDYTSYAHRSFVMARKHAWDLALDDAIKSISIQPSLTGYTSKGIALCGKGHTRDARIAFDVASMFTTGNQDSTNHFLILIKAIALFNADQHEEAMLLIKELAPACPNTDPLARRVVETYLRVQLGIDALNGARHDEAANYFTAAVDSGAFSSKYIPQSYEDLAVLFGWDLESLCLTTHQKQCQTFLSAGKPDEALEAHKYMLEFKEKCSALTAHDDRTLGVEIPGQDGYDTGPDFFPGMHQHSQIFRPQPQRRSGHLKRLRLAMTRTPHSASPPAPAPPTTPPPVAAATTLRTHLRHLFTRPSHHAGPPVVEVPYAQGLQRYAAAGAPGSEHSLIRDEDYHGPPTPDPNLQQQHPVAVQMIFVSDDEEMDCMNHVDEVNEPLPFTPGLDVKPPVANGVMEDVDLATFKPTFVPRGSKLTDSEKKEKKPKVQKSAKSGTLVSYRDSKRPRKEKRKDPERGGGENMWVEKPPPDIAKALPITDVSSEEAGEVSGQESGPLRAHKRTIDVMLRYIQVQIQKLTSNLASSCVTCNTSP
ncbi:hypothetical protein BDR03DRAFT_1015566 [Suillus americanus]|nr:hypothetical protein BDR03DRAFT_1015566 [Suillus americanus]